MRVAVYIRVARLDAGHAADRQRAALNRLASEQRWRPVGEYADRGQPGGGLDRPGLTALLDRIDQRQDVDVVAVYDLNRLTRDPATLLALYLRMTDHDVRIVSPIRHDSHGTADVSLRPQIWLHPPRCARPHPPSRYLREERP